MRWLMERIVDKMVYEEEVGHEKDGGCDGRQRGMTDEMLNREG